MENQDNQTFEIIGAAMAVHNELGQGFLESVYQDALEIELTDRRIPFSREANIPVHYKTRPLKSCYRADFICFGEIIVETKAIKALTGNEQAQILNYLKASNLQKGLLINFGEQRLAYRRFLN